MASHSARNDACLLCFQPFDPELERSSVTVDQRLVWNYLCHNNVREGGSSSEEVVGRMGAASSPKLTFSLVSGQDGMTGSLKEENRGSVRVCGGCREELEKLDKLDQTGQKLESVKRKIEGQVGRIRSRRGEGHAEGRQEGSSDSIILDRITPQLAVSVGGSVIGKENIKRALHFIGNFCDGVASCSGLHVPAANSSTSLSNSNVGGTGANWEPGSKEMSCQSTPQAPPPPTQSLESQEEVDRNPAMDLSEDAMIIENNSDKQVKTLFCEIVDEDEDEEHDSMDPPVPGQPSADPSAPPEVSQEQRVAVPTRPSVSRRLVNIPTKRERPYCCCPVCRKIIRKSKSFVRHMNMHAKFRYPCETCGKQYMYEEALATHRAKLHAGGGGGE